MDNDNPMEIDRCDDSLMALICRVPFFFTDEGEIQSAVIISPLELLSINIFMLLAIKVFLRYNF